MIREETIRALKLSLLSPNEIRKMAVAKIVLPQTYDADGLPIEGGAMDPRLGVLEPNYLCRTCGGSIDACPGHFGYIELAKPVINVLFARKISNTLKTICRKCSKIMLSENEKENYLEKLRLTSSPERRKKLLKEIKSKTMNKLKCPHCGAQQYKVKFIPPYFYKEITPKGPVTLNPAMIRERLENIPDEDAYLLGFNPEVSRPEWTILTDLPVPPLPVRPSIVLEKGGRAEDDLTHKIVDIIRVNNRLREYIDAGAPHHIIDDAWNLLQYHVATYFDNNLSGIPSAKHRTKRPIKGIAQRLEGKEGRFRSNLSGKRVDFSARTVISPDPLLDINEVGVPIEIAKVLTVPVRVNEINIEEMKKLVLAGPNNYPGVKYVRRPDGTKVDLRFVSDLEAFAEAVTPGYVVERYLMDGDIVLFNRQPSLHRISMMAHRVATLPYKTLRLNLMVCPPYNADFDGDEMNLHALQTVDSRAEAEELMLVEKNIISPRFGGALIGGILDHISAAYLLTKKDTFLNRKEAGELLASIVDYDELPEPAILKPVELWTGKQIFSLILPRDLDIDFKASVYQSPEEQMGIDLKTDSTVVIRDGELLTGVIDNNAFGAIVEKKLTMLDVITNKYGGKTAATFLNKLSRLLLRYITMKGFTLGLDEEDLPGEVKTRIKAIIADGERKIQDLIDKFNRKELQAEPGLTKEETLEIFILRALSEIRERIGNEVSKSLSLENSIVTMTQTKAKGSSINIGQMAGSVGQQSIRGRRISYGYIDRPLPHFRRGDRGAKSRGFVESSYKDGLMPTELFFHAMAGRESLVDKAIRTADSGYLQRRLIFALQDLRVENDGTVRNSAGEIISFSFGDDGADITKTYHGEIINIDEFKHKLERISKSAGRKLNNNKKRELVEKKLRDLPEKLRKEIINLFKEHNIDKGKMEEILDEIRKRWIQAKIHPFEPIGVITAQSIGEPSTQMTLRTFHYAGVAEKNITIGFPRLKEVLDMKKEPSTPSMTIYLEGDIKHDVEKAKEIAEKIKSLKLEDIAEKINVDPMEKTVVISLNMEIIKKKKISMDKIAETVSKKMKGETEIGENYLKTKSKIDSYRKFKERFIKLMNTTIFGVKGIIKTIVRKIEDEYVIETEGSNLRVVLKMEGVDKKRTTTNNIYEIYEVLGIEAARSAIIKEIKSILEEQGIVIDDRHVLLVADTLTFSGELKQVGRYGVSGRKASLLARAGYEVTVKTLANAAAQGEEDTLPGVVERIMIGVPVSVGTGAVELYTGEAK